MSNEDIRSHIEALKRYSHECIAAVADQSKHAVRHAQLLAIQKTIRQMEKRGIPVPESLDRERIGLVSTEDSMEDAIADCVEVHQALQDIVADLGRACGDLGRLRRGQRTPEASYYRPILEVLAEMGGSGETAEVVDRVGERMKGVLKDVDHDPLASSPDNPRWRNAAQWARNSMVHDGLLKAASPRGVWELSDKGRQALQER